MDIKKVVVIGSGVMGSGIAAQLANAQIPVLLLDIPVETDRNKLTSDALERMKKQKPAPFMSPKFTEFITIGNTQDDLDKIKDYDWVIEVIIERLNIKQDLYRRIDEICGGKIIVSSNTSSIKLHDLISGRSPGFQQNFLITHFFNPPRYMRLMELVVGDQTNQNVINTVRDFIDERLGKTVVYSHDTPGFIANRIGVYVMLRALDEALKSNLSIDDIDGLFTKAFNIPKTGVFGLFDLVGLDVMALVGGELFAHLPAQDLVNKIDAKPVMAMLKNLIDKGYTGKKGLGGFYRMKEEGGKKVKESLDLKTGNYTAGKPKLDISITDLKDFLSQSDDAAKFAWAVISDAFYYSASLVPTITDDIMSVDRAIRLGFNWKLGPFEMMDQIGPAWIREQFASEGREIPPLLEFVGSGTFYQVINGTRNFLNTQGTYQPIVRQPGVLRLKDIKDAQTPVLENECARTWDIGDGVLCFEFKTKENTFEPGVFDLISQSIDLAQSNYKALIFHNETDNFSLGMNLKAAANIALQPNKEDVVAKNIKEAQQIFKRLKFAPFPVVSGASGMALGGGCELLLHCDSIVAYAELYMGLVEVGLGIVPGWGGCKEMLLRAEESCTGGALLGFRKVFETIGTARVSTSAFDAKKLMFLRPSDIIIMNRDRVLFEAKKQALSLVPGYKPKQEQTIRLPGSLGRMALNLALDKLSASGKISAYDRIVLEKIAFITTGGNTNLFCTLNENKIFDLECQSFIEISRNQQTKDRIQHFVKTSKILRN